MRGSSANATTQLKHVRLYSIYMSVSNLTHHEQTATTWQPTQYHCDNSNNQATMPAIPLISLRYSY